MLQLHMIIWYDASCMHPAMHVLCSLFFFLGGGGEGGGNKVNIVIYSSIIAILDDDKNCNFHRPLFK